MRSALNMSRLIVFATVFVGQNSVSVDALPRGGPHMKEGTIVHEIAHQFDYIWAKPTLGPLPDGNFLSAVAVASNALAADTDCNHAFTATTCAEPDIANQPNNLARYLKLGFTLEPKEVFAYAFEHSMCLRMGNLLPPTSCSDFPDLEKVIDFSGVSPNPGYFDQVRDYVDNLIDNPPAFVQ